MTDLRSIDLIIGYGSIIGQQDIYFNLHLLMSKYEWDEKITYSNLLKLKYSIDFEYHHVLSMDQKLHFNSTLTNFYHFHEKFSKELLNETFLTNYISLIQSADIFIQKEMPYLKQFLSNLETWLLYLLNHIIEFSKEIQLFIQQFFFTSSISISCFRILLKTKEELDELLDELQAVRSIVLEKATNGGVLTGNEQNSLDNYLIPGARETFEASKSVPVAPLPTYNPQEHLTVVAEPNYQVDNYEWFNNPSLAEVITLPQINTSSPNERVLLRGQPLAANSPLARKLTLLRMSSAKLSPHNNSQPSREPINSPPPTPSSASDTYSLVKTQPKEVLRIIEMLQSVEGINCNFFIPMNDRQESKLCPGKLFIRNYLPKPTTNTITLKKYDPTTATLEIHLNSSELQINVILSFNIMNEIDQARQGVGMTVPLPRDQLMSSSFHISIKEKPEALLSINDVQQFITFIDNDKSNNTAEYAKKLPSHYVIFIVQALNTIFQEVNRLHQQKKADALANTNAILSKSIIAADNNNNLAFSQSNDSWLGGSIASVSLDLSAHEEKIRDPLDLSKKGGAAVNASVVDINEKLENYDKRMRQSNYSMKSSVTGVLQELNDPTVITLQAYYWVNVVESRWFQNKKHRLLLMKSDRMIDMYKIPTNHNTMLTIKQSSNASDHSLVIANRLGVNKRLELFKRSKFIPSFLTELGFVFQVRLHCSNLNISLILTSQKNYAIDAIRTEEDLEEEKEDHSLEISVAGR